ncbi:MAG TPA: dienelactone hydrolase family protein [Candidatus Sulfotelmatobacter sp.]|jgi:predicted esterase|nr:dienelactone hydrolase family protein [Candidatus Sulfotelmatobacter sp.]
MTADPHAGQPVLHAGAALAHARIVAVLLHGRGGSAEDILGLASELSATDVAYIAPQAAGGTWYPHSFLAPISQNEPWLGSALRRVDAVIRDLNVVSDRVAIMGFSQGACLTLEFAARNAGRYAAVVALTGGLIGPSGTPRDYPGSFDGTPIFIGCSDVDPHVPLERVHESTAVLTRMGASVDERIYPGMPHTVNQDEIHAVDALLARHVRR